MESEFDSIDDFLSHLSDDSKRRILENGGLTDARLPLASGPPERDGPVEESSSSYIETLLDEESPPAKEGAKEGDECEEDTFEPDKGWKEIVLDPNGLPRQAGAELPEGQFIKDFRSLAERNLFVFAKGVLGYRFLSPHVHKEACDWLTSIPPHRKLLMLPRLHAKSAIVSQCLPFHVIIQNRENNLYMPGMGGSDCRILLACETEGLATRWLRVIKATSVRNQLLHAFWPGKFWENPRKEAGKWSETEVIFPRETEWPDPTVRAIGVGGAITGARPNILIGDDLISLAAANSEVVMQSAIEWMTAAKALLDEYEEKEGRQSLLFLLGTHWAVWDLYVYIEENDDSVEILKRSIVESDKVTGEKRIIWPERWTFARIEQLKKEFGSMFPLLYMNEPFDPALVVFDVAKLRYFELLGSKISPLTGKIRFQEDERDELLNERISSSGISADEKTQASIIETGGRRMRGRRVTAENFHDVFAARDSYIKAKFSR